jgi:amino acid permease
MRQEWSEAGPGQRIVFGLAAAYWLLIVVLAIAAIVNAGSGERAGFVLGTVLSPLLLALIARAAYAFLSRRRPRPRVWSWWILVIGAAISLVSEFGRVASDIADRAS